MACFEKQPAALPDRDAARDDVVEKDDVVFGRIGPEREGRVDSVAGPARERIGPERNAEFR